LEVENYHNYFAEGVLVHNFGKGSTAFNGGNLYLYGGLKNAAGANGNTIIGYTSAGAQQGSVGIGTSSPSARLDVYGLAGSSDIFALSSSTNARLFTVSAAGNVTATGTGTFGIASIYEDASYNLKIGNGIGTVGGGEGYSVAIGNSASAIGGHALAIGQGANTGASTENNYATALGYGATASGNGATAIGNGATASGSLAQAIGIGAVASSALATAIGTGAVASHSKSFTIGNGATSTAVGQFTIGGYNPNANGGDGGPEKWLTIVAGPSTADNPTIASLGNAAFGTGLTLGIDDSTNTAGTLKLFSAGANNYYTTFTAGTQTANATYTLPTAMAATSSQALLSSTAGVLSWGTDFGVNNITTTGKGTFGTFKLGSSSTSGYVLKTDASGNGTWQAPSAINPFDQSLNTTDNPTFAGINLTDSSIINGNFNLITGNLNVTSGEIDTPYLYVDSIHPNNGSDVMTYGTWYFEGSINMDHDDITNVGTFNISSGGYGSGYTTIDTSGVSTNKITADTTDPKLTVYTLTTRKEVQILDTDVPQDKKGMNVYFNQDTGKVEYWNTLTGEISDGVNVIGNMNSLGTVNKADGYFLNYTDYNFYKKGTAQKVSQEEALIKPPQIDINALKQKLGAEVDAIGTSTISVATLGANPPLLSSITDWVGQKITATFGFFTEITADKVTVNKGIEMKDQDTGAVYCIVLKSGNFVKTEGACKDSSGTVAVDPVVLVIPPPTDTVIITSTTTEAVIDTSTTTATTTATTTEVSVDPATPVVSASSETQADPATSPDATAPTVTDSTPVSTQ
jgi:hypothetical protein